MAKNEEGRGTAENGVKRRRRRQSAPVEEVVISALQEAEERPTAPTRGSTAGVETRYTRWQRWRREVLPSFGLSPTFRAYLFIGSALAILGFLLYNESIIRELRDQERNNVDLYAKLISLSPLATDAQSIAIFEGISSNPSIDFPIIVTDHRGEVTMWKGVELAIEEEESGFWQRQWRRLAFWKERREPFPEKGSIGEEELHRLIEGMDATNEPISFFQLSEVQGFLYAGQGAALIVDSHGKAIQWRGRGLPAQGDTTEAAARALTDFLAGAKDASEPVAFVAPVGIFSYLHFDGRNAVVTSQGETVAWKGEDLPAPTDTTALAREEVSAFLQELEDGGDPLAFEIPARYFIHYGDSALVRRITRATFVQVGALMLFLLVGYIGFRNIKRSEQRSIWVGMAKETAHQLGTPLSSLAGWLELIGNEIERQRSGQLPEGKALARIEGMTAEMGQDMQRLTQIASRFSQIGSVPELRMGSVVAILEETIAYFTHRGSQFGRHRISVECHDEVPPIPLNADLIGWVFENLFKNAIDAIEKEAGQIEISIGLLPEERGVQITFQDDGKGIEPDLLGRIFDPGFSTKKRGWGLGLAFVKRIVEDYHGGRISVVQSVPGEGTTFELVLPLGTGEEA